MSLINHRSREIHVKIVYYGPGMGGKTTNVQKLHERLPQDRRGRLVSIATEQERTLFFDFMPVALGAVNGFTTRIHLYTVPVQIYYRRSRRAVLQGVDGIVFVADSQPQREQDNAESMGDLLSLLGVLGFSAAQIARLPRVIQYNKRDVADAMPIERMRAQLNPDGLPEFEAVAKDGVGVPDTMRTITKAVLARFGPPAPAPPPPAPPAPRPRSPKPPALAPTRR